jgi:AhpD family alkylhydroperoxidase
MDVATIESMGLAVSEDSGCSYCARSHVFLGTWLTKFGTAELDLNRRGAATAIETRDPLMTGNTDAQIRDIYDRWHETIVQRDVDGLMALYAENAIFETPAILVTLTDRGEGILRGKSELRPFFEAGFRKLGNELSRWYRTGLFFSNGRQLTWDIRAKHRRATRSIWSRSWILPTARSPITEFIGVGRLPNPRCRLEQISPS